MKIFVTGGSGFIGSHLIDKLVDLGFEVTNYDIVLGETKKNVDNIVGNIMNYSMLKKSMEGHDAVCHLAAVLGVVNCINNEDIVYKVNYEGVINVIKAATENNIQNVLFASTSEVYGEGKEESFLVETAKLSPKSVYGKAKMMSEKKLKEVALNSDTKITVLRYCNIYGPRQRKEFLIPILIEHLLKGEKLPICSDGSQKRNYTYIDDAVEGTIKALFREDRQFEIYNICSSTTYSVLDVAKQVIELNNGIGEIEFKSFESIGRKTEYEVLVRIPSNKKAVEEIGFKENTMFIDGLRKTYDYYINRN